MILVYDEAGRITRQINVAPPGLLTQCGSVASDFIEVNGPKIQGISASTHFVKDGKIRALRKPSPAAIARREAADAWEYLRVRRDQMLAASDWTQLPDAPGNQAEWAAYRQALRDMTKTAADPMNPVWPAAPGEVNDN